MIVVVRIDNIKPHLDMLRYQAGFYVNERLYQFALTIADEQAT